MLTKIELQPLDIGVSPKRRSFRTGRFSGDNIPNAVGQQINLLCGECDLAEICRPQSMIESWAGDLKTYFLWAGRIGTGGCRIVRQPEPFTVDLPRARKRKVPVVVTGIESIRKT